MSISIYYVATRTAPISSDETEKIRAVVTQYCVNQRIEEYMRTRQGLNWESFNYHVDAGVDGINQATTVFRGSTKLPDNTKNALWEGVQHWCQCISAIRRVIPNAYWQVRVEDHLIKWNPALDMYEPNF